MYPQEEGKKTSEKQKAADRISNRHLCSELNKVTPSDRFELYDSCVELGSPSTRASPLLLQVIDASDVVLEVLDARDPLGFRCPQLEEAVLQREGNKKLLLVLNKIGEQIYTVVQKYNLRLGLERFFGFRVVDLVPKENVEKWLECLQAEFPVVAFKATIQPNKSVGGVFYYTSYLQIWRTEKVEQLALCCFSWL